MATKRTTEEAHVIHTPGGMHRPPEGGEAADGADIASTDMSVDPGGSRADPAPAAEDEPAALAGRVVAVAQALERLAASGPDTPAQALREGVARAGRALREALARGAARGS